MPGCRKALSDKELEIFVAKLGVKKEFRNYVALAMSLVFYAWGEPKFILVLLASAVIDFYLGNTIMKTGDKRVKKFAVTLGVVLNLAILVYFKYTGFLVLNFNEVLARLNFGVLPFLKIALPVGVSFIVFEKITYLVDVYRSVSKPADKLSEYFLYVFLFPKLLAGPIIKYHEIARELKERNYDYDNITYGITRFSIGLGKKVLIADTVGELVDAIFKVPANQLGTHYAWLGAIGFAVQIYFDFSGYSDMAIGLTRLMGFHLPENFNMPYISANFSEFWHRWHISLSTWIREYLYIPLGGNRVSKPRAYFNLWFCFLLSGLWHGASWPFIIWGIYHGSFLILDKMFLIRYQRKLPKQVNMLITFFLLTIGWVIFRSNTMAQAIDYLATMFSFEAGTAVNISRNEGFYLVVGLILCFVPATRIYSGILSIWNNLLQKTEVQLMGAALLLVVEIGKIFALNFNPFLYFRF